MTDIQKRVKFVDQKIDSPPDRMAPQSALARTARTMAGWMAFGALMLVACEVGARLDDKIFDGLPFFANLSYQALYHTDADGFRVPHPGALWKKVRLNNLGMRGKDVAAQRHDGCQRIMFLGASETFGDPSAADAEYPAQLGTILSKTQCVEILNPALPGIYPQGLASWYSERLQRYEPDIVYIYPSTHFYLAEKLPRKPQPVTVPKPKEPQAPPRMNEVSLLDKSRFIERLRDAIEKPDFIERRIQEKQIHRALIASGDTTLIESVPEERLALFAQDLRELVATIRDSHAEPILITHAIQVTDPPRPEDYAALKSMRRYTPRATERVIVDFNYAAAETMRQVARETGTRLVDVSREMSGKGDLFLDLVHFTPAGHERVARLLAKESGHAVQ
jgi:hypothetical protein